jgi:hypothetical protein
MLPIKLKQWIPRNADEVASCDLALDLALRSAMFDIATGRYHSRILRSENLVSSCQLSRVNAVTFAQTLKIRETIRILI